MIDSDIWKVDFEVKYMQFWVFLDLLILILDARLSDNLDIYNVDV